MTYSELKEKLKNLPLDELIESELYKCGFNCKKPGKFCTECHGCKDLGTNGCNLEPKDRPEVCVRYICFHAMKVLTGEYDGTRYRNAVIHGR